MRTKEPYMVQCVSKKMDIHKTVRPGVEGALVTTH